MLGAASTKEKLYRISGRSFVVGIIVEDNIVVRTAPYLYWLRGSGMDYVVSVAKKKGWTVKEIYD